MSRLSRVRQLWSPAGLSRDFQLFWAGNTSSLLGDRISFLGSPDPGSTPRLGRLPPD